MSSDCDRNHTSEFKEVIESNMLREPLLECCDDQQHFVDVPSPLNTNPTSQSREKVDQCLLQ